MVLVALSKDAVLRTVFTVYGGFWITVVVLAFFGVGALLRKRDRAVERRGHGAH